jgi:hypothetical protein
MSKHSDVKFVRELRPILKHSSKAISFNSASKNVKNVEIDEDESSKYIRLLNLKVFSKDELYKQKNISKAISNHIINFNTMSRKKIKKINQNYSILHRVMYNCEINKEVIQIIIQTTNEFFSQIYQEFDCLDFSKLTTVYRQKFIPKFREFLLGDWKSQNKIFKTNETIENKNLIEKYYFTLRYD